MRLRAAVLMPAEGIERQFNRYGRHRIVEIAEILESRRSRFSTESRHLRKDLDVR